MVKPSRQSPAALSPASAFWCPSQSHGTFPKLWIQDVLGLWRTQWDRKKSSYWQRLLQTAGNFQKHQGPDLCLHSSNEPCTALVSKDFSLAQSFLQVYKQQGRCSEIGGFLMKTPPHQHMPPLAPFRFRRAACISLEKRPLTSLWDALCFAFSFASKRDEKT